LKSTASLRVSLSGGRERESLASVLAPDNVDLPRGLALATSAEGNTLEYTIESESVSTCLSTVLGLLGDITLFQEVWLLSQGPDARASEA
jgi:hypothetical protein